MLWNCDIIVWNQTESHLYLCCLWDTYLCAKCGKIMALSTPKKEKLRQINNAGTGRWFCIKKIVKYADQ